VAPFISIFQKWDWQGTQSAAAKARAGLEKSTGKMTKPCENKTELCVTLRAFWLFRAERA
jgi:hypothetical protein